LRWPTQGGKLGAMREPSRLALEVQFDARPIRGRLYDAGGRLDRPFAGWLGLMAALDAASAVDRTPDHEAEEEQP
jgi:hypothetical protein